MKKYVTAYAPASIGNLTVGFDLLGMAVAEPGDLVQVAFNEYNKVQLVGIEGDGGKLPRLAEENTASFAVLKFLEKIGSNQGIDVYLKKQLPLGSGMGSSAASAVAALIAVNELCGKPLSKQDLAPISLLCEELATGAAHGDNALPSLFGGIVLITGYAPLSFSQLPIPENLFCTLIHPDLVIHTKDARAVVPQNNSLQVTLGQMGDLASFIIGLYESDKSKIKASLTDRLAEPYRKSLIKGFDAVRNAALNAGAMNCGISGSGPSIYALSEEEETAKHLGEVMQNVFNEIGIQSDYYFGLVRAGGAEIVEAKPFF